MYTHIHNVQKLAMGWQQLVGSLKIQVSFAKEPYKRDPYFAKKIYILKESTNRCHPISHRPHSYL